MFKQQGTLRFLADMFNTVSAAGVLIPQNHTYLRCVQGEQLLWQEWKDFPKDLPVST